MTVIKSIQSLKSLFNFNEILHYFFSATKAPSTNVPFPKSGKSSKSTSSSSSSGSEQDKVTLT